MKKVLIIGKKGMLGQELVKIFKGDKNYKVVAWDKEDIDITREKEVAKKISIIHPEIIINAAAYNAVDKCENKKEFEIAKKVNGLAPGYLAAAAKKNKAIFVHYSSDYVFSGIPEIPEPSGCTHSCATCSLHADFTPEIGFCEDDKPKPVNAYGKTKLLGEKAVAKNMKKYYLIRTSWLFGAPATSAEAKRSFFDVMLELGKKNKEVHPVKSPAKAGDAKGVFNGVKVVCDETSRFTYAPDLARKTKEMIDAEKPFGLYHITNSDSVSWHEACVELYKLAKLKTKIIPVPGVEFPRPAARPYYSVLLNTKLNPLRSYKEALKEYLK